MVKTGNCEWKFAENHLLYSVLNHVSFDPGNSSTAGKQQSDSNTVEVMLADDDEDDRMFFADAMRTVAPSVRLTTVGNGEDLIAHLKQNLKALPDIIFMDINMPYKNGLECLREIKSNMHYKHLPVLIYSTSINKDQIDVTYRNGASLYIQKPARYTDITRILKNVFAIKPSELLTPPERENFLVR